MLDQSLTSIKITVSEELFLSSDSGSSPSQQGLELWVNIFELAQDLPQDYYSSCELLTEAIYFVLSLLSLPIQQLQNLAQKLNLLTTNISQSNLKDCVEECTHNYNHQLLEYDDWFKLNNLKSPLGPTEPSPCTQ